MNVLAAGHATQMESQDGRRKNSMLSTRKLRLICALVLSTALLIGVINVRLSAQGTIGSILGTVSDPSGSGVAGARVQVINTGTNAIQSTTTDSQGRYRVPALPV